MIHNMSHHPSNKHAELFLNAVELKERVDSTHETTTAVSKHRIGIGTFFCLNVDFEIFESFENGCTLLLSISGGKDSDAMVWTLKMTIELNGWNVTTRLIHADLETL